MTAFIEQGLEGELESNRAIEARKLVEQAVGKSMPLTATRTVNLRCGKSIKPLSITWLWHGWLPAGKLTILAGAAGTGKTTLALALAAVLISTIRNLDGVCYSIGQVA